MGCRFLREVVIEEGVTDIGKHAFKNCWMLKKVKIPESAKNIDKTAFENCSAAIDIFVNKGGI